MANKIATEKDYNPIIGIINKKIHTLEDNDVKFINDTLLFHECEPMAASERIAEYLGVSYESIFELIN